MHRALVVSLLLVAACTSTTAPASPKNEGSKTTEAKSPVADPEQWTCAKDQDCTQTCLLGAVSREWIAKHPDADTCDDGCGWKSGMTACRDSECVTLTAEGDIDESCTKQPRRPAR